MDQSFAYEMSALRAAIDEDVSARAEAMFARGSALTPLTDSALGKLLELGEKMILTGRRRQVAQERWNSLLGNRQLVPPSTRTDPGIEDCGTTRLVFETPVNS